MALSVGFIRFVSSLIRQCDARRRRWRCRRWVDDAATNCKELLFCDGKVSNKISSRTNLKRNGALQGGERIKPTASRFQPSF